MNLEKLKSEDVNVDKNLSEICSRWRIVSPNYCIRCLRIHSGMCSCMTPFLTNKKRINFLQTEKNYYTEPGFDNKELKWTSKNKHRPYLSSLAPEIGESQLEYQERLKWEFAANIVRKEKIKEMKKKINNNAKQINTKPLTHDRDTKGDYCYYSCRHYREEFSTEEYSDGYYTEIETSYCALGNNEIYNRDFCEDYER